MLSRRGTGNRKEVRRMDNRCIFCGEIIPEGRQVCPMCEKLLTETKSAERFDDVLHDWILPVGLVILIIIFVAFVLNK